MNIERCMTIELDGSHAESGDASTNAQMPRLTLPIAVPGAHIVRAIG
jgi:hypothetical protein